MVTCNLIIEKLLFNYVESSGHDIFFFICLQINAPGPQFVHDLRLRQLPELALAYIGTLEFHTAPVLGYCNILHVERCEKRHSGASLNVEGDYDLLAAIQRTVILLLLPASIARVGDLRESKMAHCQTSRWKRLVSVMS